MLLSRDANGRSEIVPLQEYYGGSTGYILNFSDVDFLTSTGTDLSQDNTKWAVGAYCFNVVLVDSVGNYTDLYHVKPGTYTYYSGQMSSAFVSAGPIAITETTTLVQSTNYADYNNFIKKYPKLLFPVETYNYEIISTNTTALLQPDTGYYHTSDCQEVGVFFIRIPPANKPIRIVAFAASLPGEYINLSGIQFKVTEK